MAYESINVTSLRNAINNCLNSINYSKSSSILSQISSNDIWQASSKDTFKNALLKIQEKNKNLEKQLKQYLNVVDLIEKYQKINSANTTSINSLASLNTELSTLKQIDENYTKNNKQNTTEAINNRQKINSLNTKINNLNSNMSSNKTEMNSLKSKIDSMM